MILAKQKKDIIHFHIIIIIRIHMYIPELLNCPLASTADTAKQMI